MERDVVTSALSLSPSLSLMCALTTEIYYRTDKLETQMRIQTIIDIFPNTVVPPV